MKRITKVILLIATFGIIILILGLAGLTGSKSYANTFVIAGLSILLIDVFIPVIYEIYFK